jgi:hypothetical protein
MIAAKNPITDANFKIDYNTSWYSGKFIEYAREGFVIEPLENFATAILSGSTQTITGSILNLAKLGHSSGMDSAVGVVIATAFGKDDRYCKALLKKFNL